MTMLKCWFTPVAWEGTRRAHQPTFGIVMNKSLVFAAAAVLVLSACGQDHKQVAPAAAAAVTTAAPAPAPAPVPLTATDAKPAENAPK